MRFCNQYPYYKLIVLFAAVLGHCYNLSAQEEARHNRFQYRKYHWKAYHGGRVNIYFPADAADSIYKFVLKETPDAILKIKKATIKDVPKELNIIIYPSVDQVYETNIGAHETGLQSFPTFLYKGARIVLAYNGSFADLKEQLYEGLARSLWESQMNVKSDYKEAKAEKNDALPLWYKEGSIRYFANGWTIAAEDKLRQSFEQNHFTSWPQVLTYQPRLGGHAFCYFLTQKYFPKAVAQTFFQLIKKRSLPKGIRLITKRSLDSLYVQCFEYYYSRFSITVPVADTGLNHIVFPHRKGIVSNVQFNSDKSLVAYTLLAKGARTVYVYSRKDKAEKKIARYKLAPWISEHTADPYPLIIWHKNEQQLYVTRPLKRKISIRKYSADGGLNEKIKLYGVDGITSMQPLSDKDFLLGAYRKGQSDIVSYNETKDKFTAITNDEYDDSHPLLTGCKNELLFLSDRPREYQQQKTYLIGVGYKKDTLWQGIYTINGKELKPLAIDSAKYVKWDKPTWLQNNNVLVSNTKFGSERFVLLDHLSGNTTNLGEYNPYQYLTETEEISFFRIAGDSVYTTQQPIERWIKSNKSKPDDTISSWLFDHKRILALQAKEDSLLVKLTDTTHTLMNDVFSGNDAQKKNKNSARKSKKKRQLGNESVKPYVLQLHSAYYTAQVNNDFSLSKYQPYANYQGEFKFPEVGGMSKGAVTDLLENHHLSIAYSLPVATEGSNFITQYENTEGKLDWGLSYNRRVETLKPSSSGNWVDENGNKYPGNAKVKTHYYDIYVRYPLSYDCNIGLKTALRQDRTVFLATDKYTLNFPPIISAWSINTLSYNLNKLHPTIPYLSKGFKINATFDVFKGFDRQQALLFGTGLNFSYHKPLYKYITLVSQLHVGYSSGEQKVLYNLGGKDNNVTPKVDTSVHFSQSAPYAFQTLITPFRGYFQNSLYGDMYMLINTDIYFPIFQTLIPIETPLPAINYLQLGVLSDLGAARETWNSANTQNGKWKWSYGLFARTVLAGYPLRIDIAWPGTFSKKPVIYFSLNLQ